MSEGLVLPRWSPIRRRIGNSSGRPDVAHATRAVELVGIHGRPEEGDAAIRLAYAYGLHATGRHEEAARAIREAETELLATAAKIQDERWRTKFLESIPEHAETIRLARVWAAPA